MNSRHAFTIAALMLLAGAAGAQPTKEIPLSPPQYGPVSSADPFVASDGTNFLVAWVDGRGPSAICANRVTRTGEILDGTGIRVLTDPANPDTRPFAILGLFHVDGVYTLLYKGYSRSTGSGLPIPDALYAVIISDDGRVLDAGRKVIDRLAQVITASASRILVFCSRDLFVLNGHGDVIDQLPRPSPEDSKPAVASNGSTFLMVSSAYDGVAVRRTLTALDSDGRPIATTVPALDPGYVRAIQSDGTDYLILGYDPIIPGYVATSASARGEIRSKSVMALPNADIQAVLLWTGQKYLMVASGADAKPGSMALLSLDRTGSALSRLRVLGPLEPPTALPRLAGNGSEYFEAWTGAGPIVLGALVDADGAPLSPVLTIPSASTAQTGAFIARGGVYDLAVWEESTGIYATRVAADGTPLDGRGILVRPQKPASYLDYPVQVVFDGTAYVVAWRPDAGAAQGQRIDPSTGSLLGPPVPLAACGSFALGYDGKSLIVFSTCTSALSAQRVDSTGAIGTPVSLWNAGTDLSQPQAAWNGHQWLVVWREIRGGSNVYCGRLSSALSLLDAQPLAFPAPPFDDELPLVASDGQDFAVVWTHHYLDSYGPTALSFRAVSGDGRIGNIESLVPQSSRNASLVWDGLHYAVIYTNTCSLPCLPRTYLTHFDVQDDHSVLLDSTPIGDTDLADFSLAGSANGRVRIVYTRYATEPLYGGSTRVFLRDDFANVPRRRAIGRR